RAGAWSEGRKGESWRLMRNSPRLSWRVFLEPAAQRLDQLDCPLGEIETPRPCAWQSCRAPQSQNRKGRTPVGLFRMSGALRHSKISGQPNLEGAWSVLGSTVAVHSSSLPFLHPAAA